MQSNIQENIRRQLLKHDVKQYIYNLVKEQYSNPLLKVKQIL